MSFRAIGIPAPMPSTRLRVSSDGVTWTEWRSPEPDGQAGALIYFDQLFRFVEVDSSAVVTLLFIDPGVTPSGSVRARRIESAAAGVTAPPIVTRGEWGCTPESCPSADPPSYTTVTHLIVHHTAGANDATDWAAVVRSIWILHVKGNGWNDIGYNYLIDPNGILYEGRAGGDGVLGAHFSCVNGGTMGVALLGTFSTTPPPAAAMSTLAETLAWQAFKWNLDPTGKTRHTSSALTLDVISGHRDANLSTAACGSTECPGNGVYVDFVELRARVAQALGGACVIDVSNRNLCAPAEGGSIFLPVSAPEGCEWSALSGSSWIAAFQSAAGLRLDIQPNPGARRSSTVTVGGHVVSITQSANAESPIACVAFNGVVSAASDTGRPVVPGALVSIYGSNLALQETSAIRGATLPTELGGVSIAIDGRAAPLVFVSPTQINAQVPFATSIGSARMVVTVNSVPGPESPFSVTEALPAVFVNDQSRAIAVNADGRLNGLYAPARAGDTISIYLTGAGTFESSFASIGGRPARVWSIVPATGLPGVYQATLSIPADLPAGDTEIVIVLNGAASKPATITVSGS